VKTLDGNVSLGELVRTAVKLGKHRVGIGELLRSRPRAVLSLIEPADDPKIRLKLKTIVARADGLGAADQGAVYDALRDVAKARSHVELRGLYLGEGGLQERRQTALAQLDAAISAVLDAVTCRPAPSPSVPRPARRLIHRVDLGLFQSLPLLQERVRELARWAPGEAEHKGRAGIPDKAALIARLVELGATTRDAHYLVAHVPPAPTRPQTR
jgi:hypothetical protein